MNDFNERFSGKADEKNTDLWGGTHVDPGLDGSRTGRGIEGPGPGPNNGLLGRILAEFHGVEGSLIPPSRRAVPEAALVEANTLIGDSQLGGAANDWVEEALTDGTSPADRINRACAIVWLGAARWREYDQDAANAYWRDARLILSGSDWGPHRAKAERLSELMRGLPE